ncbi:MAG TPA: hypothetical protein VL099_11990 [Candidatus Binatia bacterium]|nr:hypothetical protein [Candidatus Binatia bacterium]
MKSLTVLLLLFSFVRPGQAQTADEIIAKNIAARGGIEKLRAIRTMVVTAQLTTPRGEGPLVVRLMRPDKIQEDLTLGGVETIRTFDGKSAWMRTRKSGAEDTQPLAGGDVENLRDEGENGIDGSLADYEKKGNTVTFDGAAVVPEGNLCYKLKVILRSGHVQYLYIDTKSFLEVREEIVRTFNGKETLIEETVSDWRSEGGVLFAHTYVSGLQGSAQKSTLRYVKVEVNPPLDEGLFRMPKPGAPGSPAVPKP